MSHAPAPTANQPEWDAPAVTLREAAQLLGLTEPEVLMRVFRGALPSLVDGDGDRRVPLSALDGPAEAAPATGDVAALGARVEALAAQVDALGSELREARARIDAAEGLAGELQAARARIAALETSQRQPGPPWLRYWEACCRWLGLTA